MEIKEALLLSEKERIIKFLKRNELDYEDNITKTFYIEENDAILGTVSIYQNIIKCFAVDIDNRNENYGGILISKVVNYFYENKIYHYLVYTKLEYLNTFMSFGFEKIVETDTVCILEAGTPNIIEYLESLKHKIEYKFDININNADIGCLVMNCNPVTIGHLELIELAAKRHQYVLVFILEEDLSFFSYKERMTLLYLACNHLPNVVVIPSSSYIVSSLTFPNYFLRNEEMKNKEWATTDAKIFKNYFMKYLNISKRYIGTESNKMMVEYNKALKNILGNKVEEIKRYQENGIEVSASIVRKMILEGKIEEASLLVPKGSRMLFYQMAKTAKDKYLKNNG